MLQVHCGQPVKLAVFTLVLVALDVVLVLSYLQIIGIYIAVFSWIILLVNFYYVFYLCETVNISSSVRNPAVANGAEGGA